MCDLPPGTRSSRDTRVGVGRAPPSTAKPSGRAVVRGKPVIDRRSRSARDASLPHRTFTSRPKSLKLDSKRQCRVREQVVGGSIPAESPSASARPRCRVSPPASPHQHQGLASRRRLTPLTPRSVAFEHGRVRSTKCLPRAAHDLPRPSKCHNTRRFHRAPSRRPQSLAPSSVRESHASIPQRFPSPRSPPPKPTQDLRPRWNPRVPPESQSSKPESSNRFDSEKSRVLTAPLARAP